MIERIIERIREKKIGRQRDRALQHGCLEDRTDRIVQIGPYRYYESRIYNIVKETTEGKEKNRT